MNLKIVLLSPLLIAAADPTPLPPPIKAMLDAAIASGNDADVDIIVTYARAADPASGDAAQAVVTAWRADKTKAREAKVRSAGLFDLWTGKVEAGGFITTGNSDTLGATAAIDLTRDGLRWRHKIHVLGDYQRSLDVTTRKHLLAAYEANYKLDDRRYIYGTTQFESDAILGYDERYTASVGAGYAAIKNDTTTLALEVGPAYRITNFTDRTKGRAVAARGSLDFDWKISPTFTLSQDATAYVESGNSTLASTTAITATLIGPLAGQLSYNVQYESAPPIDRTSTDTIGRASIVYSF